MDTSSYQVFLDGELVAKFDFEDQAERRALYAIIYRTASVAEVRRGDKLLKKMVADSHT